MVTVNLKALQQDWIEHEKAPESGPVFEGGSPWPRPWAWIPPTEENQELQMATVWGVEAS